MEYNKSKFKDIFDYKTSTIDVESFYDIAKGDIDLAMSLLCLFKDQVQKCLNDYNKSDDFEGKMHAAHAIKGASGCIAANQLREISSKIERNARNKKEISHEIKDSFSNLIKQTLEYIAVIELRKKE